MGRVGFQEGTQDNKNFTVTRFATEKTTVPHTKAHRALLVTCDEQVVREFHDVAHLLGHQYNHVTSEEEALAAIDDRAFCYVFLDLNIKAAATSPSPTIEAGMVLLGELRRRHLDITGRGKLRMQILVATDQSERAPSGVRVMQGGANDVLVKPLRDNRPTTYDKVLLALRQGERYDHARCAEARAAYGKPALFRDAVFYPASDVEYEQLKNETTLFIDLRFRRVFYRGHAVPTHPTSGCPHLQKQPLAVLAILALHHGQEIDEVRLNEIIFELSLLDDNVGTNLRGIKRRIVQPLCEALADTDITQKELKSTLRVVRGMKRIVLQVQGSVRVVGLAM